VEPQVAVDPAMKVTPLSHPVMRQWLMPSLPALGARRR
jgi:hypothetical protein